MATIALVDYYIDGHKETWLKLYSEELLKGAHRVLIVTTKPEPFQVWIKEKPHLKIENFQVLPIEPSKHSNLPKIGHLISQLRKWQDLHRVIKQSKFKKVDLVFFMFFENWLVQTLHRKLLKFLFIKILDYTFPYNWSCLYFNPVYLRTDKFGKLYEENDLFIFKSKKCKAIATLDEGVLDKLSARIGKPIIPFPDIGDLDYDPAYKSEIINEITKKARGRKIIGIIGTIQGRKGIPTLLEIARLMEKEDVFFVIAGEFFPRLFTEQELNVLLKAAIDLDNVYFHIGRISDGKEFNGILNKLDIVYAAYYDFYHSSNLLTKIAYFKKPLITSNGYLMEERVNRYKLGMAIPERNFREGANGINTILKEFEIDNELFASYFDQHKIEVFMERFNLILSYYKFESK